MVIFNDFVSFKTQAMLRFWWSYYDINIYIIHTTCWTMLWKFEFLGQLCWNTNCWNFFKKIESCNRGVRLFFGYATELYTFNMFIHSQYKLKRPNVVYSELDSEVRYEVKRFRGNQLKSIQSSINIKLSIFNNLLT